MRGRRRGRQIKKGRRTKGRVTDVHIIHDVHHVQVKHVLSHYQEAKETGLSTATASRLLSAPRQRHLHQSFHPPLRDPLTQTTTPPLTTPPPPRNCVVPAEVGHGGWFKRISTAVWKHLNFYFKMFWSYSRNRKQSFKCTCTGCRRILFWYLTRWYSLKQKTQNRNFISFRDLFKMRRINWLNSYWTTVYFTQLSLSINFFLFCILNI